MKLGRLFTIILILLLLVTPLGALAELELQSIRVQFVEGYSEEGAPIMRDGIAGNKDDEYAEYSWGYADETQTYVWIKVRPDLANLPVSIYADYYDTENFEHPSYTLYDTMGQTDILNLSGSEFNPASYSLRDDLGEITPSNLRVTMSTQPNPLDVVNGGNDIIDPPIENGDEDAYVEPPVDENPIPPGNGEAASVQSFSGANAAPAQTYPPDAESTYANVYEGGMVYPVPNAPEPTLTLLPEDVVIVTEDESHAREVVNGLLWVPVSLPNDPTVVVGFMLYNDITFMTAQDEATYKQQNTVTPPKEQDPFPDNRESDYAYPADSTQMIADNGQVLYLSSKDVVQYQPNSAKPYYYDDDGKLWMYVSTGSTQGYIQSISMTFMTKSQEDAHLVELNPTPIPQQMPNRQSDYAYIGTNGAALVNANNKQTIRELVYGDVVIYQSSGSSFLDDDNRLWVPVTVDDNQRTFGYVKIDALDNESFMTSREEGAYLKGKETASPSPTPTDKPTEKPTATPTITPSPSPSPTPQLPQISGYMRVNTQYAPLLSWADYGGTPIAALNHGEVVYVQKQVYDNSGNIWNQAQQLYSGAPWGYVQTAYLTAMTPSEVNEYFATPRPVPTAAPTFSPASFSGYAVLTTDRVNFRSAASSQGSILSRLGMGTIVRVIDETVSDGYTWYRCESGGTVGYLRGDMISLMSISQYQSLVQNPSYVNNSGTVITPTATANISSSTWTTPRPGATSTITFVTIPPLSTASPDPSASPDSSASPDPSSTADGVLAGNITPSPDPNATLPPDGTDPEFPTEDSGSSAPSLLLALGTLAVLGGGGAYGYTVYNKSRKKQAADLAKKATSGGAGAGAAGAAASLAGKKQGEQNGAKPAVRRPVPPTQPGQPGQQRPGGTAQGTRPGAQGTQQRPGTATGQNPYARPQSQQQQQRPRTQDVTSPLPRSQVDGAPVNPYAKPDGTAAPGTPAGAPGTGTAGAPNAPGATGTAGMPGTPGAPGAAAPTGAQGTQASANPNDPYQYKQRMPIAPEAVNPDEATSSTDAPAPRRRRRSQAGKVNSEGEQNPTDEK